MIKVLLSGWFVIQSYSMDAQEHNYLVKDSRTNYHIAMSLSEPLSSGENTFIKLKIRAECTVAMDSHIESHFCNALSVKELKCTERNSLIVNGIRYC